MRQIDAAVTQQDAGITQIFTALNELSSRMHEAITLVREAEDATQAIHRVAREFSAEKDASRAA